MDHNEFDFYDDLSLPFSGFLIQCGINVSPLPNESGIFEPPFELFEKPESEPEEPPKPSGW